MYGMVLHGIAALLYIYHIYTRVKHVERSEQVQSLFFFLFFFFFSLTLFSVSFRYSTYLGSRYDVRRYIETLPSSDLPI